MTQKKQDARSPLRIPVAIAAVLAVILFISAWHTIQEHSAPYSYEIETSSYIYAAERGRFGDLYDTAIRDSGKQGEYSTEVAECRALAFYYEQAVLEHAYRKAGNTEKADEFAARMKEYEAQLGSMASKAEAVREAVSNDE